MLELKVWLPKYLKIDDQYQVVWNGSQDNVLPIGTILQPYDTPYTQVVTFENYEVVPDDFRLVINQGIVTWLTIVKNSTLENSTFLPTFINATMALVLRKTPVKNMMVSLFNLQPPSSGKIFFKYHIFINNNLITF